MMCVARSEHLNIEWIVCNIDHLDKGVYVVGSVGMSVCLWTTLLWKLWTDWDEILRSGSK